MPKSKIASNFWTERVLQNAVSIKNYFTLHFSAREVNNFYSILEAFEIAVCAFPELYPHSTRKKNIRRGVLSKVLSVYYRIHGDNIEVLSILDNRCDLSKWLY